MSANRSSGAASFNLDIRDGRAAAEGHEGITAHTMDMHLASIWESISDELGDEDALLHGDRRVSWASFEDRAARLSTALAGAGLQPGSVVAIDVYNCPEFFEAYFAAIKGGFVPTMVNYRYRATELHHLLADAEVELIIASPELSGAVRDVAERLPALRRIVELGAEYEAMIGGHTPAPRRTRQGEGTMLSYTGGTTGQPKGVIYGMERLTGQALRTRAMVSGAEIDETADPLDVVRDLRARGLRPVSCPASPLMHSTAFTFVSLPTLTVGGAVATLENTRFDADLLIEGLARHRATATAVVGDAFARPLATALDGRGPGEVTELRELRVMCSAGVAFSADTKRRLLAHLPNLAIVDACGSTEGATFGMSITRAGDAPTNTFWPVPGTLVVDENRRPVSKGEVGYLSGITVTTGYRRDPEKTAQVFYDDGDDRRVIPGDFGRIEADGSLTLLGRGSTVINTGGEKVHPEEVENLIKSLPGVRDVVVRGFPDERLGAIVGALVHLEPSAELSEDAIHDLVRQHLAGYKAPRRVHFVAEIPRHANGKLDGGRLDALLATLA